MKVKKIWDKSRSNFSIEKLLALVAGFANLENSNQLVQGGTFVAKAKTTYIDEDGDEVTISSDDELKDSFLQVLASLPSQKLLCIKVTVVKDASEIVDGLKKSKVSKGRDDDEIKTVLGKGVTPPDMPLCPITGAPMVDPVVAADGLTYDRHAITKWLQISSRSPLTNELLAHHELVPNYLLLSKEDVGPTKQAVKNVMVLDTRV